MPSADGGATRATEGICGEIRSISGRQDAVCQQHLCVLNSRTLAKRTYNIYTSVKVRNTSRQGRQWSLS